MADEAFPIAGTNQITDIVGWESFFTSMQLDAIYYGIQPSLDSGARTITISDGAALCRGFYKPVYAPRATTVPAVSAQNRVDRLVLRLDRSQAASAANFIKQVIIQGTSGVTTPPALTRVISPTGIWDLPVCRWTTQSNGALSGLVDERYWLGGGFTQESRTQGLLPTWPPRVGVEVETKRVYRSDGAVWTLLLDDTGDLNIALATGTWDSIGPNLGRKTNGVCSIDLNVKVKEPSGGTTSVIPESTVDATGVQVGVIPTDLRPSRLKYFSVVLTGNVYGRLQVEPDGDLKLFHTNAGVESGAFLRATLTYVP